ncbi:DHS-like NAD/FAD-binding domain-containing protein [Boletus reticuloceps]|uniref:DHS-like NAD/FAD-binding domain-containing protein n=1 Tax=Boletus reticuloceps TaxID=495285 RepID=A0A8I2YJT6_9AGAM|nr:DHS-like NAD/FAD-binding domain-containing protein [Boletus reticuloceps]
MNATEYDKAKRTKHEWKEWSPSFALVHITHKATNDSLCPPRRKPVATTLTALPRTSRRCLPSPPQGTQSHLESQASRRRLWRRHSVQAGIPDFRSPTGLFQTLKRDNPKEALSSGKDLFDASVFNSEHTTSLFCQMIAQLSELSQAASPTPFHQLLRLLDDHGRLLRVYTQNIDAIESKSGLSFGVPEFEDKRCKPRSRAKTAPATTTSTTCTPSQSSASQPNSRLSSPTVEVPRCIPLTRHASNAALSNMEETRQLVGKRARGVGKLRPSVVLYNELHKDGEGVGEIVRRDLVGGSKGKGRSGADVLLVVGTSLRVPGTKRMVREFSKAVRSRGSNSSKDLPDSTPKRAPITSLSPRRSSESKDGCPPIKSIYLNLDFPVRLGSGKGYLMRGYRAAAKEAVLERKRKREEEAASGEQPEVAAQAPPVKRRKTANQTASKPTSSRKRKSSEGPHSAPRKPRSDSKSTRPTPSKTLTGSASKPMSAEKVYIRIPSRRRVPQVVISTHPPLRVLIKEQQSFPATPPVSQLKHRKHGSAGSKHDNDRYPPSDNTDSPMIDSDLSDDWMTTPLDSPEWTRALSLFYLCINRFNTHCRGGFRILNRLMGSIVHTVVRTRHRHQQSDRDTNARTEPMSSTPNTSKPDDNASKAPEKPKSDDVPHLGVLEEDDEFEEFECAAANASGDKLWEDNWDDDDIEDEFSVQLR